MSEEIQTRLNELIDAVKKNKGSGKFNAIIEFIDVKMEKYFLITRPVEKSLEKWVIPFEFNDMNTDNENKEIRQDILIQVHPNCPGIYCLERKATS